jgi:hypothetical protein
MNITMTMEEPARLVATLREGETETAAHGAHGKAAATELLRAIEEARTTGYGECFWHEVTGQYWWMFRREETRVEVVVLWSSGAVTGWQHVFRATDEIGWLADRVREQLAACGAM